jgi:hypothetical protein
MKAHRRWRGERRPRSWPTPALCIPNAAAQTRMLSAARIHADCRKSVRAFKRMICDDISEFGPCLAARCREHQRDPDDCVAPGVFFYRSHVLRSPARTSKRHATGRNSEDQKAVLVAHRDNDATMPGSVPRRVLITTQAAAGLSSDEYRHPRRRGCWRAPADRYVGGDELAHALGGPTSAAVTG